MENIRFNKGIYKLNSEPNFDFQLNRLIMWNGGDLDEVKGIANKIVDSASWKKELIALGDKAMSEERIKETIAYYRLSEFFMYDGDPDKKKYYNKATALFYSYYDDYFKSKLVERISLPYEDVFLPVMLCRSKGKKKGTLLLHGGNDSYFEELFFPMLYLAEHGFDVYLFEGPGQGGVLRLQNKHFTYQWEKPVSTIFDYFGLNNVIIIGASLGGMLAPRAAAYEKRISAVIAWSIFPSFLDMILCMLPKATRKILRFLLKHNCKLILSPILWLIQKASRKNATFSWGIQHGMYAYQADSLYEYLKILDKYQMIDTAHLIDQDIFIVGARDDHFIDYRLINKEIAALSNAKSLTFRLFTAKEQASNHCNVGNIQLVLDSMIKWAESIGCDNND